MSSGVIGLSTSRNKCIAKCTSEEAVLFRFLRVPLVMNVPSQGELMVDNTNKGYGRANMMFESC